nr:nucleoside-diphosphate sugar epimerase/dehydratase [uncultured Flavobacterium sp.]
MNFTNNETKIQTTLKNSLKRIGYIPRWIILAIDISLVAFATLLSHLILNGIGLSYVNLEKTYILITLLLGVHLFFFWKFKTFSGIVRHSSLIDALQLFFAEFATLITLYLINIFYYLFYDQKLFLNTGLLIIIIFSYCLLLSFRITVKTFFEELSKLTANKKEKVLIFGKGNLAIAIANSIISDKSNKFEVIGFIDSDSKSNGTKILNLPIYNLSRRPSVLARSLKTKILIFGDDSISKEQKINLIDDCINYNVKVLTLPPFADINDEKNIFSQIRNIKIEDLLGRNPICLDSIKISTQIKNKVVLVSGAAGSIGSEIVCQVLKFNPSKLILLDQAETPLHIIGLEISKVNSSTEVFLKISDIRNQATLEEIFKEFTPDIVYHAAAYKHVPLMEENPSQAIHTNVIGTKNLADLSIKYNTDRFVMVSTDKAVNPSNVMGCSKRIAEKYVQSLSMYLKENKKKSTKFITTRFGNVLGSNGSVVPLFTKQIENGGPITITHPDIIRYFMTIPEACQLVLEAGSMGNGGEIYIFDMGKPVKIIDLANKMIKLAGLQPKVDIDIKFVGLRPGEKLFEELLNDGSTSLPTHHEKIMIAVDIDENFDYIQEHINDLIKIARENDKIEIVKKMKFIVPEFISMNSEYDLLDKKECS